MSEPKITFTTPWLHEGHTIKAGTLERREFANALQLEDQRQLLTNDVASAESIEQLHDIVRGFLLSTRRSNEQIKKVDATAFATMELASRPMLLEPFLQEKSIGMVHAWRGVGKTHVSLGIAAAVATGGQFLRWKAPAASPVLYLDGEMADCDLQLWLRETLGGMPELREGFFSLITPDLQTAPIPNLSTVEGQAVVEGCLGDAKLLVLDNISCLFRSGNENENDAWSAAQEWLLQLRRNGVGTLLVHHDGKMRVQRGTSKREDPMNYVIQLKHPADYNAEEGLRAEVHFTKARRLHGAAARPFEAKMEVREGKAVWATRDLNDALAETVRTMHEQESMSIREIAKVLDISRAKAHRLSKTVPERVSAADSSDLPF